MATRGRTMPVRLRIFDEWRLDPPDLATFDSGDGAPKVVGRANGYPLEARIWRSRPAGIAEAIWHPAGIWLAIRVLDPVGF